MRHQTDDKRVIPVIDELLSVSTVAHRIWHRELDARDISIHVILAREELPVLGDGFSDQRHDVVARSAQGGKRL